MKPVTAVQQRQFAQHACAFNSFGDSQRTSRASTRITYLVTMSGSQGNQKGSKRFELEEIDDQDTMSDNERYNERGTTEGLPALLAGLANRTPDELAG